MIITEIYRSSRYRRDAVANRYTRRVGDNHYRVFEVNAEAWTIREYDVTRDELPDDVAERADMTRHMVRL